MKHVLAAVALVAVAAPSVAHAHHGGEAELVRQAAMTLDLGWPILAAVGLGFVAQVRSFFTAGRSSGRAQFDELNAALERDLAE